MKGALSQLHNNKPQLKQYHLRITFEDIDVFRKGPRELSRFDRGIQSLKATLSLVDFHEVIHRIQVESESYDDESVLRANITSYVMAVFALVNQIITQLEIRDRELKIQLCHLSGESNAGGASSLHTNGMRDTCSTRVWCIDTDGLGLRVSLLNQAESTNVVPMNYILNSVQKKKSFRKRCFQPQLEREGDPLPQTWECEHHLSRGVDHFVIFSRPNLEGITRCSENKSHLVLLDFWEHKKLQLNNDETLNTSRMVKEFGIKPTYTINDIKVQDELMQFEYPLSVVDSTFQLFMNSLELTRSLPIVGITLGAEKFCEHFQIPPNLRHHIVDGGVCVVKRGSNFTLPESKVPYGKQVIEQALTIRRINMKILGDAGRGYYSVGREWNRVEGL